MPDSPNCRTHFRLRRRQKPIVIESRAARDAHFPDLAADDLFRDHETSALLPLPTGSRAVGIVVLSCHDVREAARLTRH